MNDTTQNKQMYYVNVHNLVDERLSITRVSERLRTALYFGTKQFNANYKLSDEAKRRVRVVLESDALESGTLEVSLTLGVLHKSASEDGVMAGIIMISSVQRI